MQKAIRVVAYLPPFAKKKKSGNVSVQRMQIHHLLQLVNVKCISHFPVTVQQYNATPMSLQFYQTFQGTTFTWMRAPAPSAREPGC